jgi:hypothetical protein
VVFCAAGQSGQCGCDNPTSSMAPVPARPFALTLPALGAESPRLSTRGLVYRSGLPSKPAGNRAGLGPPNRRGCLGLVDLHYKQENHTRQDQ